MTIDGATTDETGRLRRIELASFLRASRERLDPAEAEGGARPRRRVKGWLREEVAAAAGISATWYMWLEQARDVRASPRALTGLVRALRLDSARAAYLFRLARPDLNPEFQAGTTNRPSDALIGFIQGLSPLPAYVLDVRWDIVAHNEPARCLLGDIDPANKWSYNLLARILSNETVRARMLEWERIAASCVAQYRAASATFADDPEHVTMVEALKASSTIFRSNWEGRSVEASPNWIKRFDLPEVGVVSLRYQTLRPAGEDEAMRVTIYSPVADADRDCLLRALAAGGSN